MGVVIIISTLCFIKNIQYNSFLGLMGKILLYKRVQIAANGINQAYIIFHLKTILFFTNFRDYIYSDIYIERERARKRGIQVRVNLCT